MRLSALFAVLAAVVLASGSAQAAKPRAPAITRAPVPYPPVRPGPSALPMPPPKPAIAALTATPEQKPPPAPALPEASAPAPDPEFAAKFAACRARLDPEFATIALEAPISGPGECGAADLVRLKSIKLEDGRRVDLEPAPKIRCSMAEALTHWIRTDVAPLAARVAPLQRLVVDTSYECRRRNHASVGKISQHGMGNAVDIRALTLSNGKPFVLTDATADKEVRAALQASACARFTTVLGPGSDGVHEDHIHLDIAERRNGYRICQWDVR